MTTSNMAAFVEETCNLNPSHPKAFNHNNSSISTASTNSYQNNTGSNNKRTRQHKFEYSQKRRLFASEFICTFVYTYLGQCALTSFELLGTQNDVLARQLCTILGYGLAYLLALLMSANMSPNAVQTALNPAITFAYATFKLVTWSKVPVLLAGQYLGALFAAPILHATFSDKLAHRHEDGLLNGMNETLRAHGNVLSTGKFFTSFPPTEVTLTQLFISYTLATCFLTLIVATLNLEVSMGGVGDDSSDNDSRHQQKLSPLNQRPLYVSLGLILVIAAFCANGGPVLNPAQDLSPRLYIALCGWGASAFNMYRFNYWWFCGFLAPHLGAVFGVTLYQVLLCICNFAEHNHRSQHHHHHLQHYKNSVVVTNNYSQHNSSGLTTAQLSKYQRDVSFGSQRHKAHQRQKHSGEFPRISEQQS